MSTLKQNPFHTIRGWYWTDEEEHDWGPYATQTGALRGLLDHVDPRPSIWRRIMDIFK